jgi:hypothetical protein
MGRPRALGYFAHIPLATAIEKNLYHVEEWFHKNFPAYLKEAMERSATILLKDESGVETGLGKML